MACSSLPNLPPRTYKYTNTNCTSCGSPTDATCVNYTGAELSCIGATAGSNLEQILLLIDAVVCQSQGSWSGFNYYCLSDITTISTPQQFAETISNYVCTTRTDLDTFIGTTYPSGISGLQTQINSILNPNLTLCSGTGIVATDTYTSIVTKLANGICDLQSSIDVSTVNWNQCLTVTTPPTTVSQAFDTIVDMVCTVYNSIPTVTNLPTFNNVNSCLPSPVTATDTLVDTVNKIKERLCETTVFDIDSVPWGCVSNPSVGDTVNLQAAINTIVTSLNTLVSHDVTFDSTYFSVTEDGCNGRVLSLINIPNDRLVASNASDSNPGTLEDKLQAGSNITIDTITTSGKVIISSTNLEDKLVKSSSSDPTAGYLSDKMLGGSDPASGLNIETALNTSTNQVDINPSIDWVTFIREMFTQIENNTDLYGIFCNLMCGCEPCNTTTSTTTTSKPAVLATVITDNNINSGAEIIQVSGNSSYPNSSATFSPALQPGESNTTPNLQGFVGTQTIQVYAKPIEAQNGTYQVNIQQNGSTVGTFSYPYTGNSIITINCPVTIADTTTTTITVLLTFIPS